MSIPVIALFNNKGGVGKTSLVYHLSWMYSDLGFRVLAADLDPQANLTAALLDEDQLERLWSDEQNPGTIFGCVQPLIGGTGDIRPADPVQINLSMAVLPGDLSLSRFEDDLSNEWPRCMDGAERAFRVVSAFWRVLQGAGAQHHADLVLVDLGPNLGAINRAALIAADFVVVPLSPDLFSLQGLKNLGPTLVRWRREWAERKKKNPVSDLPLPQGRMVPVGYIVLQHAVRLDRPVKAYDKWIARIPHVYRKAVLEQTVPEDTNVGNDAYCLSMLKHYRSLMPLSQEARKPMFFLKPADGAIGAHMRAVDEAYRDFRVLAERIAQRANLATP